jgi:hypothetical protein
MVMNFPLEAFKYVCITRAEPGTIAADDNGNWFLMARTSGAANNQAVRLSRGPNGTPPGELVSPSENDRVFIVSAPYSCSIRVDDIFDMRRREDGPLLGAILLAEPLAIFTVDSERRLIGLDGHEIDAATVHRQRARYVKWSVWLIDPHGRQVGDKPLVEIDATAQ